MHWVNPEFVNQVERYYTCCGTPCIPCCVSTLAPFDTFHLCFYCGWCADSATHYRESNQGFSLESWFTPRRRRYDLPMKPGVYRWTVIFQVHFRCIHSLRIFNTCHTRTCESSRSITHEFRAFTHIGMCSANISPKQYHRVHVSYTHHQFVSESGFCFLWQS
jgi:hypothetical protein